MQVYYPVGVLINKNAVIGRIMTRICRTLYATTILFLLACCGRSAPGNPTATNSPTAQVGTTSSPSQERTARPSFTRRPSATPSPTPTSTPTPTPVPPLSEQGPWLVIHADEGIWVSNADGTGLTRIANSHEYQGSLRLGISPHGGRLAFFYPITTLSDMLANPPELMLMEFPSTSPRALTRLHSGKALEYDPSKQMDDPNGDVISALFQEGTLAWSPDGSFLAFVGAQDGPSTDLYRYSTLDGSILRLTSGPTQTLHLSWSPDGRYIVSEGAERMYWERGGSLPAIDSVWAAQPDGSHIHAVQTQFSSKGGEPSMIGWVNNSAFLEEYFRMDCSNFGLTFVNVEASSHYTILPGAFGRFAFDPASGTALALMPNVTADYANMYMCGTSLEPGLYLFSIYDPEFKNIPFEIPSPSDSSKYLLSWSPEAHLFFIFTEKSVYTLDLQGKLTLTGIPSTYSIDTHYKYPDGYPLASPDGTEWAVFHGSGLWVASPGQAARAVFSGPVDDAIWMPDGSALLLISRGMLYHLEAPDYQAVALAGPIQRWSELTTWQMDWAMP